MRMGFYKFREFRKKSIEQIFGLSTCLDGLVIHTCLLVLLRRLVALEVL